MAHPAAMRNMARLASVVPRPGVRPTPWQQEVGRVIADAYRVFDFDPETFVCIGEGRPIGYPRIEFDVQPQEWDAFAAVNRDPETRSVEGMREVESTLTLCRDVERRNGCVE